MNQSNTLSFATSPSIDNLSFPFHFVSIPYVQKWKKPLQKAYSYPDETPQHLAYSPFAPCFEEAECSILEVLSISVITALEPNSQGALFGN